MFIHDFVTPTGANYTEFLRDYLANGNVLPAELSQLDTIFECDFKEVFKQHYLMHEIGFQTEELFTQKLKAKCLVEIPYYKEKAEALKTIFNDIFENGFSIKQTNNLTNAVINDKLTNIDYNTPTGSASVSLPASAISGGNETTGSASVSLPASAISGGNETTHTNTTTNTGSITTTYSKNPKFNSYEALTKMQEEFTNIMKECLNAFACMFMEIY